MSRPPLSIRTETLADAVLSARLPEGVVWHSAGQKQDGAMLAADVRTMAGGLRAKGVKRGTRVGVQMTSSAQRLSLILALWSLGAIVVPLDPAIGALRMEHAARLARLGLLLHDADLPPAPARESLVPTELQGSPDAGNAIDPEDPALLLFDDRRHGVILSHAALLSAARGLALRYALGPADRVAVPLPLNSSAFAGPVLAALLSGAELVDPATASHLFVADPAATATLVSAPVPGAPRVVLACGDGRAIRALGRIYPAAKILNGWARAELGGIALCSDPRDPAHTAHTTFGRPLPGIEVMIVDPQTGMDRLLYEIGEVWIRGKTTMLRYDRAPKVSAQAFDRTGFFHTEEMGFLDSEGRVILTRDAHAQI